MMHDPGTFQECLFRHRTGIRKLSLHLSSLLLLTREMLAHGMAVQAIRSCNPQLEVGIVLNQWAVDPASDNPADLAAAELAWNSREIGFLHPIFRGYYHPQMIESAGNEFPEVQPGDMALISQKLDFLGINTYSRSVVGKQGPISPIPGSEYTDMGWEVCAPAFRRLLNRINRDYHLPPIYITENGIADVGDMKREKFIKDHLICVHKAIQEGVDVRGYFHWSLLDNFEWDKGFWPRFGLVEVDYKTMERKIRPSAREYAKICKSNQLEIKNK